MIIKRKTKKNALADVQHDHAKNSITSIISRVAVAATIIGYASLISYTWPLGFIPVISIEALPILLIGFFPVAGVFLGYVFALWFPLYILEHDDIHKIFFGKSKSNVFEGCNTFPDYLKRIFSLIETSMFLVLLLGIFVGSWYLTCKDSSGKTIIMMATWTLTAYFAFGFHAKAKTTVEYVISYSFLGFVFLILPVLYSASVDKEAGRDITNLLVKEGLISTGLGGGIPVKAVLASNSDEIFGRLLFYDGKKAWINLCGDKEKGEIIESDILSITHLDTKNLCEK